MSEMGDRSKLQFSAARIAIAGLMLALWLAMGFVAVSPQLHNWIHADAQSGTHQCLAVQLSKGPLLPDFAAIGVPAPVSLYIEVPAFEEFQYLATANHRLCSSRGPPSHSVA